MTDNDPGEFVPVLVPKKHVTRVYGLIASLDERRNGASDEPASTKTAPTEGGWSKELIERQYRESPPSMKKFQRFLAEHPGQEFSTSEMAEPMGAAHGWNSVAGALGAYGRRVKHRYKRDSFPFASRWDHENEEQYHSMTPEVAEIIRAI